MESCPKDKSNYLKAANTNVQVLLADVDDACDYFASVSFDPEYDISNVVKFQKLPQHDDGYCDIDISSANVERLPHQVLMVFHAGCFSSVL